jgi:predicted small lipoprotein YifL
MRAILSLSALTLAVSLTACGAQTPHPQSPVPPAELTRDLDADPQLGATNDDQTVGRYIVDWRYWGCVARARYNALRAWAVNHDQVDATAARCQRPEAPPANPPR